MLSYSLLLDLLALGHHRNIAESNAFAPTSRISFNFLGNNGSYFRLLGNFREGMELVEIFQNRDSLGISIFLSNIVYRRFQFLKSLNLLSNKKNERERQESQDSQFTAVAGLFGSGGGVGIPFFLDGSGGGTGIVEGAATANMIHDNKAIKIRMIHVCYVCGLASIGSRKRNSGVVFLGVVTFYVWNLQTRDYYTV